MLGPNELVNAAPDGYTLSQLTIGVMRLPHMQKMQFDPLKDFTYIACLTGYTFGIVVRADSPIKSIKDLVDFAKAKPGEFTYGSTGNGTTPHLAVEEFAAKAGIKLQHIPFKGNADGMQALLGGHVMSHSDATRLGHRTWTPAPAACWPPTASTSAPSAGPIVPTLQGAGLRNHSPIRRSAAGGTQGHAADPHAGCMTPSRDKTLEDPAVLASFDRSTTSP